MVDDCKNTQNLNLLCSFEFKAMFLNGQVYETMFTMINLQPVQILTNQVAGAWYSCLLNSSCFVFSEKHDVMLI